MSDEKTIFAKIIDREIPADIVYETDDVLAFKDIEPQAPTHILIVPKEPIAKIADMTPEHTALVGKLFLAAKTIAEEQGLSEGGYRLVINNGRGANQTVFHLHVHLLAGRAFSWPPG